MSPLVVCMSRANHVPTGGGETLTFESVNMSISVYDQEVCVSQRPFATTGSSAGDLLLCDVVSFMARSAPLAKNMCCLWGDGASNVNGNDCELIMSIRVQDGVGSMNIDRDYSRAVTIRSLMSNAHVKRPLSIDIKQRKKHPTPTDSYF